MIDFELCGHQHSIRMGAVDAATNTLKEAKSVCQPQKPHVMQKSVSNRQRLCTANLTTNHTQFLLELEGTLRVRGMVHETSLSIQASLAVSSLRIQSSIAKAVVQIMQYIRKL